MSYGLPRLSFSSTRWVRSPSSLLPRLLSCPSPSARLFPAPTLPRRRTKPTELPSTDDRTNPPLIHPTNISQVTSPPPQSADSPRCKRNCTSRRSSGSPPHFAMIFLRSLDRQDFFRLLVSFLLMVLYGSWYGA